MKAKIAAVLILVLLIAVLLCGCAESFTYTEYTDGSGAVHREYLLLYDKDDADAKAIRDQAILVMERYVEKNSLKEYSTIDSATEGQVLLTVVYPSMTDYYIANGYTGREENAPQPTPVQSGIVNVYDRDVSSYLTEKNVTEVISLMDEAFREMPWTTAFYYRYGTTNKTLESNGEKSEENGIYFHTWQIALGEDPGMKIRVRALNGVAVYSVVIAIFVLSLAIIFVIIYVNKRKEKRGAKPTEMNPRAFEKGADSTESSKE